MDCRIRRADQIAELVLVGSLDSTWSAYLSDQIDEVIRAGALEVLIDMAGVSYLSSNGIAILIRHHRRMRKIGGRFRIVADSDAVGHVLRLSGVWAILHEETASPELPPRTVARCEPVERDGMTLQVFPRPDAGGTERLELLGDPARLGRAAMTFPTSRSGWRSPGLLPSD